MGACRRSRDCDTVRPVASGKQPYGRIDRNDYSIPHHLVRLPLTLVASESLVRISNGTHVFAMHARTYDEKQGHRGSNAHRGARSREAPRLVAPSTIPTGTEFWRATRHIPSALAGMRGPWHASTGRAARRPHSPWGCLLSDAKRWLEFLHANGPERDLWHRGEARPGAHPHGELSCHDAGPALPLSLRWSSLQRWRAPTAAP